MIEPGSSRPRRRVRFEIVAAIVAGAARLTGTIEWTCEPTPPS